MNRDFTILGVREDASKEQVKSAYQRRLARYKSDDYADDPEYVSQKISQLTAAYERAYSAAGSGASAYDSDRREPEEREAGIRRIERDSARRRDAENRAIESARKERRRQYEKERQKLESEEGRITERLSRRREEQNDGKNSTGGRPSLKMPDLSVLKEKAEAVRANISESGQDMPDRKKNLRQRADTQRDAAIGSGPVHKKKTNDLSKQAAGVVIAVLLAFVGFLNTMCDGSEDMNYSDWEDDSYTYEIYDYSEKDLQTYDSAQKASELLYSLDYASSWEEGSFTEAELELAANAFVRAYTGDLSLPALTERLSNEYEQFSAVPGDDLQWQLDEVLQFYGFPFFDEANGMISPYTGETMGNRVQYLQFLIRYHDEHFAEDEGAA